MSDIELRSLTDVDRIIHEPARLLITTILFAVQEADFLFLLRESGLTKGNLSSHLAKLEEAGYITIEKKFIGKKSQTICSLTEEGRNAFETYREQLKRIMNGPLKGKNDE